MKEFIDIGLPVEPGGTRVVGLAYSPASKTILAMLALPEDSVRRIFIRGLNEPSYRELEVPGPQFWFMRGLAVATSAPFAFVTVLDNITKSSHVYGVALPGGHLTRLPEATGYATAQRTWVSQVLASSPDGASLHVVAAEAEPARSDGGYSVIYSLAQMNVSTGHLDKLVDLATPFA